MARIEWELSLGLVLLGAFVMVTAPAAHASGQATKVIKFVPHSRGPGMLEGYCWTASIAIARSDAWRCMAGNEIFDPCFESSDKGYAVCNPDPAKGDPGFRLKLTKPLPETQRQADSVAEHNAWLVELADGTVCT